MFTRKSNIYAHLRMREYGKSSFRDRRDHAPPEKLLQAVWQHQRIRRDQLSTLDGGAVRVLHPGFKNHEAGPDFRSAMIQFENQPPVSGDVEIDLEPGGWKAHGHDRNPAFKNVMLQVVWAGKKEVAENLPVLAIEGMLDAPIAELEAALGREPLLPLPETMVGRCCAPLKELGPDARQELLLQAAEVRWQNKAAQLQARARDAGWEQALWEGLFKALGYKQNVWPMQCLAESRPKWLRLPSTPRALQARLLGVSGLLPDQLTRSQPATDGYIRRVWDQWWRERDEFASCALPRELWRFNGIRPANHPQRRLALASHWLASGNLMERLDKWFATEIPVARLPDSLLRLLQSERDDFWSTHWTLKSAALPKPQPLLGAGRVADLAVNVILPWCWIRALEANNDSLQRIVEKRFLAWPAAEDNSILKLARRRLLGGEGPSVLPSAAAQQGLLQIVRDFCDHSNALCERCEFPDLVRSFSGKA